MKPTREQERAAAFFHALGHRRRQMICAVLLQYGPNGLSFERLQRKTGLAASTLGHHLHFMDRGGLLNRRQKGRETWISLDAARLKTLTQAFSQRIGRAIAA